MNWIVKYTKEAKKDLKNLDKSQQILVLKAIDKVAVNPLPRAEGGLWKTAWKSCFKQAVRIFKNKIT